MRANSRRRQPTENRPNGIRPQRGRTVGLPSRRRASNGQSQIANLSAAALHVGRRPGGFRELEHVLGAAVLNDRAQEQEGPLPAYSLPRECQCPFPFQVTPGFIRRGCEIGRNWPLGLPAAHQRSRHLLQICNTHAIWLSPATPRLRLEIAGLAARTQINQRGPRTQ
jgi:hypothetical protein